MVAFRENGTNSEIFICSLSLEIQWHPNAISFIFEFVILERG